MVVYGKVRNVQPFSWVESGAAGPPRVGDDLMSRLVTTFPACEEFEKAVAQLDALGLPYEAVRPEPAYALVGAPALVLEDAALRTIAARGDLVCSGWVGHRGRESTVPDDQPPAFVEDVFGRAAIMVLGRCSTDAERIRIIAHVAGDLAEVMPYLNATMPRACYNPNGPALTYMDAHRMVTLYPHRIAVAKADDIVDAWRVLEGVRRRANSVWARRMEVEPSDEVRSRPPALEVFMRLPRTNCGACGETACLAFAVKVHGGELPVSRCVPVFEGDLVGHREPLLEVCRALGAAL